MTLSRSTDIASDQVPCAACAGPHDCSLSRRPRARSTPSASAVTRLRSTSPPSSTIRSSDTDRIQVSTAPGTDGIVRRIEVRAREGGQNWVVFALANNTDDQLDRLIVAPHYRIVNSGLLWPDLGLSRVATITPSVGDRPERQESADHRHLPHHARSRRRSSPMSRSCAPTSCRSSICGSPTPTRTRSTPSRSIMASSSASPACLSLVLTILFVVKG